MTLILNPVALPVLPAPKSTSRPRALYNQPHVYFGKPVDSSDKTPKTPEEKPLTRWERFKKGFGKAGDKGILRTGIAGLELLLSGFSFASGNVVGGALWLSLALSDGVDAADKNKQYRQQRAKIARREQEEQETREIMDVAERFRKAKLSPAQKEIPADQPAEQAEISKQKPKLDQEGEAVKP